MSASYALVVLVAVGLLGMLHVAFAVAGGRQAEGRRRIGGLAHDLAGAGDPWTRLLVAGAVAAILFALGVIAVSGLGDDSAGTLTRPTVTPPIDTTTDGTTSVDTRTTTPTTTTEPTTATTEPTTATATTEPTTDATTAEPPGTTATTTTEPTTDTTTTEPPRTTPTTRPDPPPPGAVLLARAVVDGRTGRLRHGRNRLDATRPLVRATGPGTYLVVVPGLTRDARARATLRAIADRTTVALVRKAPSGRALVVQTRDRASGTPALRDFTLVVYGARRDLPGELPRTA